MSDVPASGWFVEVDHPTASYTHTATPLENPSPSRNPKANERPSARIPVPKADKWRDLITSDSDTDLRVWNDGKQQPLDTLENVEDSPEATVLVAKGGRELTQRVEVAFNQQAVHLAAKELVETTTSYTANVDEPVTSTQENVTVIALTTTSDFLARTGTPLPTDPWQIDSGTLSPTQIAWTVEGENYDDGNETRVTDPDNLSEYSGGDTAYLSRDSDATGGPDFAEWEFTPNHRIETENVAAQMRFESGGPEDAPAFEVSLISPDGTEYLVDRNPTVGLGAPLTWIELGVGDFEDSPAIGYDGPSLEPGETYTLRIDITDSNGTADDFYLYVDVMCPYDETHEAELTFDDSVHEPNGYLDGPQWFPDGTRVGFDQLPAPQAVTGIRAEATLNAGDSSYTHYVSNDQGANFTSGTGANFETDSLGTEWGPSVTYEAGIGRTDETRDTATPRTGFNAHELQDLTLKADLEDMPLVVNKTFDGQLSDVLRKLAQTGNQTWEYRLRGQGTTATAQYGMASYGLVSAGGRSEGPTASIEWTTPGQRTRNTAINATTYAANKSVEQAYQSVSIYGQADVPVSNQRFEADHGTAVSLANDHLQQDTVTVSDPETGRPFRREIDYTVDDQDGTITTLASGEMADGDTYTIDYRYQAFGSFTQSGASDPDEPTPPTISDLSSDFLCEQAARLLVEEVSDPLHTATVTIPNDQAIWSVVEAIDPDAIPTGGNHLHVRNVENTPVETVLTLGSRQTFGEQVESISEQVSAVSRKA